MGIARVQEALEANDWAGGEGNDYDSDPLGFGSDEEDEGVVPKAEAAEIKDEMSGMRKAIYGGQNQSLEDDDEDEAVKVEELEGLMLKVQVIKGNAAARSLLSMWLMALLARYGRRHVGG